MTHHTSTLRLSTLCILLVFAASMNIACDEQNLAQLGADEFITETYVVPGWTPYPESITEFDNTLPMYLTTVMRHCVLEQSYNVDASGSTTISRLTPRSIALDQPIQVFSGCSAATVAGYNAAFDAMLEDTEAECMAIHPWRDISSSVSEAEVCKVDSREHRTRVKNLGFANAILFEALSKVPEVEPPRHVLPRGEVLGGIAHEYWFHEHHEDPELWSGCVTHWEMSYSNLGEIQIEDISARWDSPSYSETRFRSDGEEFMMGPGLKLGVRASSPELFRANILAFEHCGTWSTKDNAEPRFGSAPDLDFEGVRLMPELSTIVTGSVEEIRLTAKFPAYYTEGRDLDTGALPTDGREVPRIATKMIPNIHLDNVTMSGHTILGHLGIRSERGHLLSLSDLLLDIAEDEIEALLVDELQFHEIESVIDGVYADSIPQNHRFCGFYEHLGLSVGSVIDDQDSYCP